MKFKNFFEAKKQATSHEKQAESKIVPGSEQPSEIIDPTISKYFFDHQLKIEKGEKNRAGIMDYHIYARKMWEELVGNVDTPNQEYFEQFENEMISSLHKIDMQPLVYEHVVESLATLVRQYKNSIKHLALWSTGDVEATGYQVSKIDSSNIINMFHQALKKELPKEEVMGFMKEKTSFLVLGDKMKAFAQYVTNVLNEHQNEKMKVVIIEDSKNNFYKAQSALIEALGGKASQVDIEPIWATYSREGQEAENKVSLPSEKAELERQKRDFNAINTFMDLSDTKRFEGIFKDAHVFVDFDGVIGDNVSMRKEQAKVIYNALVKNVIKSTGLSEKDIVENIKEKIAGLSK